MERDGRPVAWVTGGATGIGKACARELGKAGYTVVISGRRAPVLEEARQDLAADEIDVHALPLDVADADAVTAAATRIHDDFGRLDVLVCSAGLNAPNRYWRDLTPEAFARVSAVNLNGVAFCVAAVLPRMRDAGGGTIVVVSSWAGWRYTGFTGAAYGATKFGLAPLVESINDQEGRKGIRATLLCPGEVATPILKSRPKPPPDEDIARMLVPEDVAQAMMFAVAMPPRACINEIVISPTWNRIYSGADDLAVPR
jgi:NAD(P)-dependent dehydrogenase (short-subunit alcohol dehydrogenase family)